MAKNDFWRELKQQREETGRPFFCVAPMADVTDAAFRRLIAQYGKPDVVWTEFVSADGLALAPEEGKRKLLKDLEYSEAERPIVAQLFSSNPVHMETAARLCAELGFDGIDINMGCPDRSIERQGAGAAMIKTPEIAKTIIAAAKRGASNLPVSVKTRVGYSTVQINEWIRFLLSQDIAALSVHARTRKELSAVPAPWERIREVVKLRDRLGVATPIIGNGDVISIADGRQKAAFADCDGIMVGRALFGNPWFFDESRAIIATLPKKQPAFIRRLPLLNTLFQTKRQAPESAIKPITIEERLSVLVEHTKLFEELLDDTKNFAVMKKHYKAYVTGFPSSKELRMQLMETKNVTEVAAIVSSFLKNR